MRQDHRAGEKLFVDFPGPDDPHKSAKLKVPAVIEDIDAPVPFHHEELTEIVAGSEEVPLSRSEI
jgi:hypothetical protein